MEPRTLRILLVQPPETDGVRNLFPQQEDDKGGIGYKPPLGLLSLATVLRDWGGHDVELLDCLPLHLTPAEAAREIARRAPDVVGISSWTEMWYPAHELGRLVKERLPGCALVYGGPHASIYPEETLAAEHVDAVVAGDGERPLLAYCDALANGWEPRHPGLHTKARGYDAEAPRWAEKRLAELPVPSRDFIDLADYGSVLATAATGGSSTMITSRGCPHKCVFCKVHAQNTVCDAVDKVVEEFVLLAEAGVREVEVYDDTFTWSKQRVAAICEELIRLDLGVAWAVRDRVNRADPELLKLMRRAGCNRVHYGIESGVDDILRRSGKGITTDQARRAVAWAKQARMTVLTFFMLGLPGEREEDMLRSIAFSKELNADYTTFSVAIPYPGTAMYAEALDKGIIPTDYWRAYALDPTPGFRIPKVYEEHVDLATLRRLQARAHKEFYLRPRYVLRQALRVRSMGEFLRKAHMGLSIMRYALRGSRANG